MYSKLYTVFGIVLCIGLGAAFASGTRAPDLGLLDDGGSGSSHSSSSGRSSFHFSSWNFGK